MRSAFRMTSIAGAFVSVFGAASPAFADGLNIFLNGGICIGDRNAQACINIGGGRHGYGIGPVCAPDTSSRRDVIARGPENCVCPAGTTGEGVTGNRFPGTNVGTKLCFFRLPPGYRN